MKAWLREQLGREDSHTGPTERSDSLLGHLGEPTVHIVLMATKKRSQEVEHGRRSLVEPIENKDLATYDVFRRDSRRQ